MSNYFFKLVYLKGTALDSKTRVQLSNAPNKWGRPGQSQSLPGGRQGPTPLSHPPLPARVLSCRELEWKQRLDAIPGALRGNVGIPLGASSQPLPCDINSPTGST